jgi:hypothetical protein
MHYQQQSQLPYMLLKGSHTNEVLEQSQIHQQNADIQN